MPQRNQHQSLSHARRALACAIALWLAGAHAAPPAKPKAGEREALIARAEAAMARLDGEAAELLLERAASMAHSADTEMALVRCYMQAGQYRRAMSRGAHTAVAHADESGGIALRAWLLHLGGQESVAAKLLREARAKAPRDELLGELQARLKANVPHADGALLKLPARLAPYGDAAGLPAKAQVVATGTLLPTGLRALVPLAAVPASGALWLRNGLGRLASGQVIARDKALGLALVDLGRPLPPPAGLAASAAPASSGSAAYGIAYAGGEALPAWPALKAGFVGAAIANTAGRELPLGHDGSAAGGPVFDTAGRLSGVMAPGPEGTRLIAAQQLDQAFGQKLGLHAMPATSDNRSTEAVYEAGLRTALQVITSGR